MNKLIGSLIFAFCAIAGFHVHAQDWPNKPVRFIVPFPPGGSVDQVARILANALTPALGQQVIVDNRAGAAGSIGTSIAAKSTPDSPPSRAFFASWALGRRSFGAPVIGPEI